MASPSLAPSMCHFCPCPTTFSFMSRSPYPPCPHAQPHRAALKYKIYLPLLDLCTCPLSQPSNIDLNPQAPDKFPGSVLNSYAVCARPSGQASHRVLTAAVERVVAAAAVEHRVAATAVKHGVVATAVEHMVTAAAVECMVAVTAVEHMVAAAAV